MNFYFKNKQLQKKLSTVIEKGDFKMEKINVIQYDKAIRDKIPEIIEASGNKATVEIVDQVTFIKYLDAKLGEELKEYLEDGNVEELADLVETVYAILACKGVSMEKFEKIRFAKAEKRGGFVKRLVLKEVRNILL